MIRFDFESWDFWTSAIKKAVAKRMIRRNYTNNPLIQNVCKLDNEDVERLLKLKSSYINEFGKKRREKYLNYYRSHKYEDWECKRIIDLNEIDIFEICEGKGQPFQLEMENIVEGELYEIGEKIMKKVALFKMTDLNYSKEDMKRILGDGDVELYSIRNLMITCNVIDKMCNHFINLGVVSKRLEITVNLLRFENNLKNISLITGLNSDELEMIIKDNEIFKGENTIIDNDKFKEELVRTNFEILIEAIVIDGMYDYQIEDYTKLSGFDCETVSRVYDINEKYESELNEFLDECSQRLMDRGFDYSEIEEITGRNIYNSASDEYYWQNYKKHLINETTGADL